jgi:predicted acylesterase/phospholipase RssA
MTIKHLVISGGGPSMLQSLGAIQYLNSTDFINIENIKSIYGTSAGALVGTLICLKYDWDTLNDYILKRPWQDVFKIKAENIFEAYSKKGLFDIKVLEKCLKPLLDAKDISINITLKELYEYSRIELHFFTFEINHFQLEDISYFTHPDLRLLTAIQMTCSLPILLTPVCLDDKCYMDGGIICNYSLKQCIKSGNIEDEIMGFKNNYTNNYTNDKTYVKADSTIFDYIINFLFKLINHMNQDHTQPTIVNEIIFDAEILSINTLKNAVSNMQVRKDLFNNGEETAKIFLKERL